MINSAKLKNVFVWWVPALVIVNVVALLGAVDWCIRIFFPEVYNKKEKKLKERYNFTSHLVIVGLFLEKGFVQKVQIMDNKNL